MHCFEPVPENYALLLLNAPDAIVHSVALSDADGWPRMELDRVNMGRSRIVTNGSLRVAATTLDSFRLDDVTLLKIDTEGHEPQVVAGARQTIAASHPAIVVEDNDGRFGEHLDAAGLDGYRQTAEWPGSNYLWEWA
jgi:FkbM family methyltransferase